METGSLENYKFCKQDKILNTKTKNKVSCEWQSGLS